MKSSWGQAIGEKNKSWVLKNAADAQKTLDTSKQVSGLCQGTI